MLGRLTGGGAVLTGWPVVLLGLLAVALLFWGRWIWASAGRLDADRISAEVASRWWCIVAEGDNLGHWVVADEVAFLVEPMERRGICRRHHESATPS